MKIIEKLKRKTPSISFEFFPPKTDEGTTALVDTIKQLKSLSPTFISMTYGAGGSTRQKTVELVSYIKHQLEIEAAAHLTCVGQTKDEIRQILSDLEKAGIENIVALRGDPPKGETVFRPVAGGFSHASELVQFIRQTGSFCIAAAGYPEKHIESPSLDADLLHLKEKVLAGSDFIVTQLFFDNEKYFSFVDRLRKMGITVPVVAGIMPVTDVDQVHRFSGLCGASIPSDYAKKLELIKGDKEKVIALGIEYATAQCRELISKGASGIHFYTLNKSLSTKKIFENLKNEGLIA